MPTFDSKLKCSSATVSQRPKRAQYTIGNIKHNQQPQIRNILRSPAVQPKLTVGQPNDKYEQEADHVADQVMAMPDPKLQRQPEEEEKEKMAQAKGDGGLSIASSSDQR